MKRWLLVLYCPFILSQKLVADPAHCPDLVDTPFPSHLPIGIVKNLTGIEYTYTAIQDFEECVEKCCGAETCNAALTVTKDSNQQQCVLVSCEKDDLCLPSNETSTLKSTLVLVRPRSAPWKINLPQDSIRQYQDAQTDTVCEVGLDQETCKAGEICVPLHQKSRNGVCRCDEGYTNTGNGCEEATPKSTSPATPEAIATIGVSVGNKTMRLPETTASLTAFTMPVAENGNPYKYEWKTLSTLPGTESGTNSETLRLAGLGRGTYIFKVVVTASNPPGRGEAFANVTVLPALHINQPPKAVINPPQQNVTLPTNKAIIDGGQSTDDSNSLTYAWTIVSGPLGFQPSLPAVPTLTLDDLIAGNYTIKLTVTDSDGQSDSAVALLTVFKETDYPPKANAGNDIVVYLPENTVVLNGNKSSDDHEIASWEWIKKKPADGLELPADITGSQTPYLRVANMEQGIYTFILKVTDRANQTRSDDITVYVKPPSNLPPTANAGKDQDLSLPLAYITLDGRASNDDLNITQFRWTQKEGPVGANITKASAAETNVTGLAVGTYTFKLTVWDSSKNNNSDEVKVRVRQDTNQAPVARIKKPGNLSLPLVSLVLDASTSSDDLAVDHWQWTRDPESVSAGTVIGNWQSPKLVLANLVQGTYIFNLKVSDGQGKSDESKVVFTLAEDRDKMAEVELVLDQQLATLSQSDLGNILGAVKIFVRAKSDVTLQALYPARRTGFASLILKVKSSDDKYLKGSEVVKLLKKNLATNPDILGTPVLSLETVVCQNSCGGHGTCNQATRECDCQAFWIENPVTRYLYNGEPNCDWSVIYVIVVVVILCLAILVVYCMYCGCCRKKDKRKYTRLGTEGDLELKGRSGGVLITTDSEETEDEDVLFESVKKGRRLNGATKVSRDMNNGHFKPDV